MSGVPVGVLVALSVLLVVLAAALVAAESALNRVSRAEGARLLAEGRRGAAALVAVLENPVPTINASIFVRKTAEACAVTCTALAVAAWVQSWWAVLLLTSLIMGIVLFVLVGVSPRTVGRQNPEAVALAFAPWLRAFVRLLTPVARLLVALGNAVTPGRGYRQGPFASEAELRDLVDIATESQEIHAAEQKMIHSVFELGDTVVREVMVPRTDVVFLDSDVPLREALQVFNASGYSRIPVIGEDVDDPVGVLYLKDISTIVEGSGPVEEDGTAGPVGFWEQPITEIMRETTWVPESKTVDSLLRQMQRDHFHLALVADEYGGTAGLVTMEDLVEEIVGEIADEHDRERPGIEELEQGTYRIDARTPIDELEELFGLELAENDVDSVGGLLAKSLGRVPIPGSHTEVGTLALTAERREGRRNRIATVLVSRMTPETDDTSVEHEDERV